MATIIIDGFTYDLSTPEVTLDGITYAAAAFTEEEARLWDAVFGKLFALGDDPVASLMKAKKGHLFFAARVAKAALEGRPFGGVEGGTTEILMQELQAWHILRTTASTETPAKNWLFSLTVDEDYWIGYGTNNLSPANIDKDACPVIIGAADLTANRAVTRVKFKVGDAEYKPIGIERLQLAPATDRVPIMPIKTLILTPRQIVQARTYSDAAITNGKLMLIGITYGLGSYLTNLYKDTVSL